VFLGVKNVLDKRFRENQNTKFILSNFFLENPAVCEIMWKNIVQLDRPQIKVWRMRIACWISKATNSHFQSM
jgi:hypothetical protein